MLTNSRLLELRATGLACQHRVASRTATLLEEDYADLFQLVLDWPERLARDDGDYRTKTSLAFLLGK
jgi:hypothetical protein